ncbi:hypothetical protein Patl1_10349 [Pistacia atlantica]|uniref:Uncharacterized protein n=1 Tax=Pistacia atlantica TaxID=434234 RepID=A0ACC1A3U4_9ROSI|nr:hypothetical protein Patl1_10349 [Pistacia atlantica]
MLPLAIQHSGDGQTNTIFCNRTIGSFSHITNINLKVLSPQGSLPRELVSLRYLQEMNPSLFLSSTEKGSFRVTRVLGRDSLVFMLSNKPNKMLDTFKKVVFFHCGGCVDTRNSAHAALLPPTTYQGKFTPTRDALPISLSLKTKFRNIEANQLSDPVPEEFGNLVNLTNLLPIKLAKLKNMKKFRISDNSFTGTVPEFIGGWTNPEMLLGSLDDLRITDMNGPKFPFPNLTSNLFKKLILRNLNMSGSVHTNNFEVTTTRSDKLEGEINGIGTTPNFMFLSGNMLSGNISETFLDTSKHLYVPNLDDLV